VFGFAVPFYRWHIAQLHRSPGQIERELAQSPNMRGLCEDQRQLGQIKRVIRSLKIARPFELDLHRLKIHSRMVQHSSYSLGLF
jgi:hypothetical protein